MRNGIPFFLYTTGASGTAPPPVVVTPPSVGGSISGGTFSRGRWHALIGGIRKELEEAELAREALAAKAKAESGRKAKLLASAARAADRAIVEAAEKETEAFSEVARLTRMLETAAGAVTLADAMKNAADVHKAVRALIEAMEEEEEDEAILLLLH